MPGFFVTTQAVDNVSLSLHGLTSGTSDPRVQPRVSVFQDGVLLVNAPVVADKLFARVAFYANELYGYVTNLANGSDLQGEDTVAFCAGSRARRRRRI